MRLALAPAIIMAVSLIFSGCSGDYREPYYTSDKEPVGTGEITNTFRNGVWTQQADNGQVVWRGSYANGMRQGSWNEWNADGTALVEANYDQNRLHGQIKIFGRGTMAGKLKYIESYDHGVKDGEWRHFDLRTGRISKIENFSKGKKHGRQLDVWESGGLSEVVYENGVSVLERVQNNGELNVQQLDAEGRHHGLWVTVVGDAIVGVSRSEHGAIRDSKVLFFYTPPGTPPEKQMNEHVGGWSWTKYVSLKCRYNGGFDPITKNIGIYRYDYMGGGVWNDVQRWTIQDGKAVRHEKKELGPNLKEFVWVPADLADVPPAAAFETIVVNPPSKILNGMSLPLEPIQVPSP